MIGYRLLCVDSAVFHAEAVPLLGKIKTLHGVGEVKYTAVLSVTFMIEITVLF
jgi:hypothetical protein